MTVTETVVRYNTAQALAELKKLNRALGETADKTVDALQDKAGEALDAFQGHLSDISPAAGQVVGKMRNLVAAAGPMGAVMGVAAAGIASVVSNLIDLPGLLADSEAGMNAFGAAVDRQREIFETFDDIGDKIAKGETERALESITLRQAEVAREQVRLSQLKNGQVEELRSYTDTIRKKERELEKSIRTQKALQRQLTDNNAIVGGIERSAPRKERAVADLSAAAQREALKGNVDLAKGLRDRAQELTDEFGGHVFFQKEVDKATQSITDGIKGQLQAERNRAQQLQSELEVQKQIANEKKRGLDATLAEQRALAGERKLLGAARKDITQTQKERDRTDKANEFAGRVEAERVKIRNEFDLGQRTVKEAIVDSFKQSFSALGNKSFRDAGLETRDEALQTLERIANTLLKQNLTPNEAKSVQPDVLRLNALAGSLQVALDRGELSGGFKKDIDQFKSFIESFQKIGVSAGDFGQQRGGDAAIGRGSQSVLIEPARNLGSAASRLDAAASKLLGVPTQSDALATSREASGQPAIAPAPRQDITVNANVKGGIIDAETTRTITDIIRKELRKNTSPKLN